VEAADAILEFTRGRTKADYLRDRMVRAAVEREFEIIGEALGQLAKLDADFARRIPDLPRIVAFRNILIHGYAMVDNETVWRAVHENLPDLRTVLTILLEREKPGS
jgi:uncharacterized protein with HEPN domain